MSKFSAVPRDGLRCATGVCAIAFLMIACGSSEKKVHLSPPPTTDSSEPCSKANHLRSRVAELVLEGRLDRTVRVIQLADQYCPNAASTTWPELMAALFQLGRIDEASGIASNIESSSQSTAAAKQAAIEVKSKITSEKAWVPSLQAPEQARALMAQARSAAASGKHLEAKQFFLSAWTTRRPYGEALLEAGRQALALGAKAEARQLLDRAAVELAQEHGAPMSLAPPLEAAIAPRNIVWHPTRPLAFVVGASGVSILDLPSWQERLRIPIPQLDHFELGPGGHLFAATSAGKASVWRTDTGMPLQGLPTDIGEGGFAFASQVPRAVWFDTKHAVLGIWDTNLQQTVLSIPVANPPEWGTELSVSPDASRVVLTWFSGGSLWNTTTRTALGGFARRSGSSAGHELTHTPDWSVIAWIQNEGIQILLPDGSRRKSNIPTPVGLALSHSGDLLAATTVDGPIYLVEVRTGKVTRKIVGPHKMNYKDPHGLLPAWGPGDKTLLAGIYEGSYVYAWNPANGQPIETPGGQQWGQVLALNAFGARSSPELFVVGTAMGAANSSPDADSWHLARLDGASLRMGTNLEARLDSGSLSQNHAFAVTAVNYDGHRSILDLDSGRILRSLEGTDDFHGSELGWSWSPDFHQVFNKGSGSLKAWDAQTGALRFSYSYKYSGNYLTAGWVGSKDRWHLATVDAQGTLTRWGVDQALTSEADSISCDGFCLVASTENNSVRVVDGAGNITLSAGCGAALHADGERIITANYGELIDAKLNGKEERKLATPFQVRCVIGIERSGRRVVVTTDQGLAAIDSKNGALLWQSSVTPADLAFSPDEERLIYVDSSHLLHAVSVSTGDELWKSKFEVSAIASNIVRGQLAYATMDRTIGLADVSTGASVATIATTTSDPIGLSPDGALLAVGNELGEIVLWNVSKRRIVARLTRDAKRSALARTTDGYTDIIEGGASIGLTTLFGVHAYPAIIGEERFLAPGFLRRIFDGESDQDL